MGGTTTVISGTPATTAGTPIITSTLGKLPLPQGTNSPADGIGRCSSPTTTPGLISVRHAGAAATCASLNARTWRMATRIASSSAGSSDAWAAAIAVGRDQQGLRGHLHLVERARGVDHRLVAARLHVVIDAPDGRHQARVEDRVRGAGHDPGALRLVHLRPDAQGQQLHADLPPSIDDG